MSHWALMSMCHVEVTLRTPSAPSLLFPQELTFVMLRPSLSKSRLCGPEDRQTPMCTQFLGVRQVGFDTLQVRLFDLRGPASRVLERAAREFHCGSIPESWAHDQFEQDRKSRHDFEERTRAQEHYSERPYDYDDRPRPTGERPQLNHGASRKSERLSSHDRP